MAFVARPATAADAPAQAPVPGARRRPMLQAERALRAAACPRTATALWCRERDAARRHPRGPPGIREQRRPPLEGAGIIHEKAVTEQWPHACRRPQAPGPRVAAVRRQAHYLRHDFVVRREVRAGRKPHAHADPEGEERAAAPQRGPTQPCARRQVTLRPTHHLSQNLGSLPQWQARSPQPVVRGGRERPPHDRFILQGQFRPGDIRRPRHPSQRPGPPNQVVDEVLWIFPVRRQPRLEPWLLADGVPRQGANEVVPKVGVAGPWARLLREEGVAVARLIPLASCHTGGEDRQVHAIWAVQELVEEVPVHPLCESEEEKARLPKAGGPPVRRTRVGDGSRRVVQRSHVLFRALPEEVGLILLCRAGVGARGVGPRAVARHLGRRPHGPGQEATQQPFLPLRGGCPQRCAAGRAIRPIAQPTAGDRAPRLQLARGVAAKAVPDPVLQLAERLLHEVEGVLLP